MPAILILAAKNAKGREERMDMNLIVENFSSLLNKSFCGGSRGGDVSWQLAVGKEKEEEKLKASPNAGNNFLLIYSYQFQSGDLKDRFW